VLFSLPHLSRHRMCVHFPLLLGIARARARSHGPPAPARSSRGRNERPARVRQRSASQRDREKCNCYILDPQLVPVAFSPLETESKSERFSYRIGGSGASSGVCTQHTRRYRRKHLQQHEKIKKDQSVHHRIGLVTGHAYACSHGHSIWWCVMARAPSLRD
jgi:hypothetical protein